MNELIMQTNNVATQYLLLSLFHFNDFLHFNIPWMIDFLFSYSFLHYSKTPKKSSADFELVNFIQGYVYIITIKTSNAFYLCLL